MNAIKTAILGFAIGDAMGVYNEFKERKELLKNPVVDMKGYGSHDVPAGSFSDDTSMLLATMDSYIEKGCFDYDDIMKKFELWIYHGKYTPQDKLFDVGNTCYRAIRNYSKGISSLQCGLKDTYSNGNGSLMRILPVVFYAYYKKVNNENLYKLIKDMSSLTHAHEISVLACYIYVHYVLEILKHNDKYKAYAFIQNLNYSYFTQNTLNKYQRILKANIHEYPLQDISSSCYVVDTLEAVLWVVMNTDTYKDAIITAINLGRDTDTIGAIVGSIASLLYGYDNIPKPWLDTLLRKDYIETMCEGFQKRIVY